MAEFKKYTGKIGAADGVGGAGFNYIRIDHEDGTETMLERIPSGKSCYTHINPSNEPVTLYTVGKAGGAAEVIYAMDIGNKRVEDIKYVSKARKRAMKIWLWPTLVCLGIVLISLANLRGGGTAGVGVGLFFGIPAGIMMLRGRKALVSEEELHNSLPVKNTA